MNAANQLEILTPLVGVLSMQVPSATPVSTGFLNLISVLLGSIEPLQPPVVNLTTPDFSDAPPVAPSDASPQQVAQSLIRSMLANGLGYGLSNEFSDAGGSARRMLKPGELEELERKQRSANLPVPVATVAPALAPVESPPPAVANVSELLAAPQGSEVLLPVVRESTQVEVETDLPAAAERPVPPVRPNRLPPVAIQAVAPAITPGPAPVWQAPAPVAKQPERPPTNPSRNVDVPEPPVSEVRLSARPIPLPPPVPASAPAQTQPLEPAQKPDPDRPEQVVKSPADAKAEPPTPAAPRAELAFGANLTPLVALQEDPRLTTVAPAADTTESLREAASETKTRPPVQDREDPPPRVAAASSATLADHAGAFAPAFESRTPSAPAGPRSIASPPETPFHATAEAIRTAEPIHPAPPAARSLSAQEITVRIAPPDAPAVDLRVIQRAGQVQVAVRTPDAALQSTLRQDLGTLVNSMERAGYHTETFAPREAAVDRATSSEMNSHGDRQESRPDFSGRDSGESSHGRQQQRQRNPQAPEWLTELEKQP